MSDYLVPPELPALNDDLRSVFGRMSRLPDIDSADLTASDQADALGARIVADLATSNPSMLSEVLILNDSYGALCLAVCQHNGKVLSYQDRSSQAEAALRNSSHLGMDAGYTQLSFEELRRPAAALLQRLSALRLVIVKLPRSNEELAWLAWTAARLCPQATLIAVGLQKYMTPAQNTILSRYFARVQASRGFGKARALVAHRSNSTRDSPEPWQTSTHEVPVLPGGKLRISGGSAVFGASRLDPGSRLLIEVLGQTFRPLAGASVIDLGCGNGTLAVAAALLHPQLQIHAVDQSASAVAATNHSAQLNHVSAQISTTQMDGLALIDPGSADHILLNPPFHSGHAVHAGIAHKLFDQAARVLKPGGQLWCVWNSPLRYRPIVQRSIGATEQLARNQKFTVSVSTRD